MAVVVVAENALAVEAADGAVVARGGGDVAFGDGAVADGAFVAVAHDAADAQSAFDTGIGDVDVVDDGVAAYLAEETLVVVGDVGAGLAESDAADGVAVAVKIAVEFADVAVVVASYALIVLVVVVGLVRVVRESDIGSEFEVLALVVVGGLAVRAVHAVGELQQMIGAVYHVWIVLSAGVGALPVEGHDVGGVVAPVWSGLVCRKRGGGDEYLAAALVVPKHIRAQRRHARGINGDAFQGVATRESSTADARHAVKGHHSHRKPGRRCSSRWQG